MYACIYRATRCPVQHSCMATYQNVESFLYTHFLIYSISILNTVLNLLPLFLLRCIPFCSCDNGDQKQYLPFHTGRNNVFLLLKISLAPSPLLFLSLPPSPFFTFLFYGGACVTEEMLNQHHFFVSKIKFMYLYTFSLIVLDLSSCHPNKREHSLIQRKSI